MPFKVDFGECRYALQEPVPSAQPRNLHSAPVQTAKSSHSQLTNDFTVITPFVRPITPFPGEPPRGRLRWARSCHARLRLRRRPLRGSAAEHEQGRLEEAEQHGHGRQHRRRDDKRFQDQHHGTAGPGQFMPWGCRVSTARPWPDASASSIHGQRKARTRSPRSRPEGWSRGRSGTGSPRRPARQRMP
jgi:hypothetical protein